MQRERCKCEVRCKCNASVEVSQMRLPGHRAPICRPGDGVAGQGVLAGQAVAGVAVSALSFVTLWATPVSGTAATAHSLALPAFLYFAAATATMVACAVGYTAMWRWPFVQTYWGNGGECPDHA